MTQLPHLALLSLLACPLGSLAAAQDGAPAKSPAQDAPEVVTQAELEAALAARLSPCRLEGFTTLDNQPGLHEDTYRLTSVSKLASGKWRFEAVLHWQGRDLKLPIALPVEWAGDTAVVVVDDLWVPGMGTYSARVMFHEDQYCGVWSGDGYGGQMFGRILLDVPQDEAVPAGGGKQASTNWPSFRGTRANGIADGFPAPTEWNIDDLTNIRWRVPVPGLAHSAPVIWGDKLFLTTAVRKAGAQELRVGLYGDIGAVEDDSEFRFEVHCFDKRSGEPLWSRVAWEGVPAIKRHPKGSHAASTPACDASRVVAFFGSEGLFAYDHDGNPLWSKNFGVLDSGFFAVKDAQWGFASSPVLHEGQVIVQVDVQDQSFLAVHDARTGDEVWRVNREEEPGWSTPTVHVTPERSQIICNGWKHIGGYDLESGEELWRAAPGGDIPVPTPIVAHDLIYITNAHGRFAPILAIKTGATGTVSFADDEKEYLAWGTTKRGNYMQTPIVYGDLAYFCRDNGVLYCKDAVSGEELWNERIGEGRTGFTASGIVCDGKLYFASEEGSCYVIQPGREFQQLGVNSLGEETLATPAASEGVIYFRSRNHLTAVALGD